jgi:hypothetical protein
MVFTSIEAYDVLVPVVCEELAGVLRVSEDP